MNTSIILNYDYKLIFSMFRQILRNSGFIGGSRWRMETGILHFQTNPHYKFCNSNNSNDSNKPDTNDS